MNRSLSFRLAGSIWQSWTSKNCWHTWLTTCGSKNWKKNSQQLNLRRRTRTILVPASGSQILQHVVQKVNFLVDKSSEVICARSILDLQVVLLAVAVKLIVTRSNTKQTPISNQIKSSAELLTEASTRKPLPKKNLNPKKFTLLMSPKQPST